MAKAIASYYASVGMDIDPQAIHKVDAFLAKLKQRLQKFQDYTNNAKALQFTGSLRVAETRRTINTQLAAIGDKLVLPIKNVKVVGKDAKAGIQNSLANVVFNIKINGRLSRESLNYMKQQVRTSLGNVAFHVKGTAGVTGRGSAPRGGGSSSSWWQALGGGGGGSSGGSGGFGGVLGSVLSMARGGRMGGLLGLIGSGASAAVSGVQSLLTLPFRALGSAYDATSGSIMRMGTRAIPLIGGAYGLGQINKANDEWQGQRMASDAIFSSGNFGVTGEQAREWLMASAMRDGFNFKDSLPQFNGFMASAMPMMGYEKSRDTFEAFTQFGRTRGASSESMGRALYALQQMAGKGQIMSEELNGQLAEAMGFSEAKGIFAEAYQLSLVNGGTPKLEGQKAVQALGEAMKKGKVTPDKIFPYVTQIMKQRAASGLDDSRNLASAQQARFMNERQQFLQDFSKNGGEAGFSTMWRTLANGMAKLREDAPIIGEYFNKGAQAFAKFFEGLQNISNFARTGEMNALTVKLEEAGVDVVGLRNQVLEMFSSVQKAFSGIFGEGGGLGDRLVAVMKAIFDTGLIKEFATYLQQTATIFASFTKAAQAFFSGNFAEAGGHLIDAGRAYVGRLGTNLNIAGSAIEISQAALQGKNYVPASHQSYAADRERFNSDPRGMWSDEVKWVWQDYDSWYKNKQSSLDSTLRAMSLPYKGTEFGAAGQTSRAPYAPIDYSGTGNFQNFTNNMGGVQSTLNDIASTMRSQQKTPQQVDVKLNVSVDVKTDESSVGLKVSEAINTAFTEKLGATLTSTLNSFGKYGG